MNILITGVTGALGKALVPRLATSGHKMFGLVRPKGGLNPHTRISKSKTINFHVVEGDVTCPLAGISGMDLVFLKHAPINMILHSAALISFDKVKVAETKQVNVNGVKNMLELAEMLNVRDFRHVSTAYIAGNATRLSENEFDLGQTWRNPYERSKFEGEKLVRLWAKQSDRRATIYRPSVIVGSHETGETTTYDGLYGFFRSIVVVDRLRKRLERELPLVSSHLTVYSSSFTKINIVPMDWLIGQLTLLLGLPAANTTYHLVHNNPPRVRWVIEKVLENLGITGMICASRKRAMFSHAHPMQNTLDEALQLFRPYLFHETEFVTGNIGKALGKKFETPPTINEKFLASILEYAIRTHWGKGGGK